MSQWVWPVSRQSKNGPLDRRLGNRLIDCLKWQAPTITMSVINVPINYRVVVIVPRVLCRIFSIPMVLMYYPLPCHSQITGSNQ